MGSEEKKNRFGRMGQKRGCRDGTFETDLEQRLCECAPHTAYVSRFTYSVLLISFLLF